MREPGVSPLVLFFRLAGSVLLVAAGAMVYTQTHIGIYQSADPEFLAWLKGTGVALIFHGALLFVAHFLSLADRKEGVGLSIVFNAVYFIQLIRLFNAPEIVPIVAFSDDQAILLEDSDFTALLVRSVVGAVLVFILVQVAGHLKTLAYLSKGRGRRI